MHSSPALIERFKDYFRNPRDADLSRLRELYSERILFRDPVREVRGLVELEDYFDQFGADLGACRFEYLDQLASGNTCYLKWNLHFRQQWPNGRVINLRGISHLQSSDRIEFHEDIYDLGAMHYEQLPRLGNLMRWLRLRRAS